MPRLKRETMAAVYAAFDAFVRNCLMSDGAMFSSGRAVWTVPVLEDLKRRFVENPDESGDSFETKFKGQLAGAPPETIQVAAELVFVYFLSSNQVTAKAKRELVELILGWSPTVVRVPEELVPAFSDGVAVAGMAFNVRRQVLLALLLEFVLRWKALPAPEQEVLLRDPWAFKSFVFAVPVQGAQTQQHALLHLAHPDVFEPLTSQYRKRDVIVALSSRLENPPDDPDRCLVMIRAALAGEHGSDFNFWDPGVRELWERHDQGGDRVDLEEQGPAAVEVTEGRLRTLMAECMPAAELRKHVFEAMARAIRAAHAVNPRSWVLTVRAEGRQGMRLSVGMVYIVGVSRDYVMITYDPTHLSADTRRDLKRLKPNRFKAETLSIVSVPQEEAIDWLGRLGEANVAAAVRAAGAKRTPYARYHAPVAVRFLREALSQDVPDTQAVAADVVREKPTSSPTVAREARVSGDAPAFSERAFELLSQLNATPRRDTYQLWREELQSEVVEPLQALLRRVVAILPDDIVAPLETDKRLFGKFLKNDFGLGGVWDYYWGALYLKGGSRVSGLQLFIRIDHDRFAYGFDFGDHKSETARAFAERAPSIAGWLAAEVGPRCVELGMLRGMGDAETEAGADSGGQRAVQLMTRGLLDPLRLLPELCVRMTPAEVVEYSAEALARRVAKTFEALFPFVLLAVQANPKEAIEDYLASDPGEVVALAHAPYPIEQVAMDSGLDPVRIQHWVAAIERKGQAILYGPPGTGKTFMAELLGKHLVGGGDGIVQIVQFHPAYAYEDFIQGIRPKVGDGGVAGFEVVRGRFLEFCRLAEERTGCSVLIIDEINRANLSRVFGELMYLLEYREKKVPLAAGREFQIPAKVRIIGTMNTADRSIALVDHALRRRFAFLALKPDYEVLRRFHAARRTDFPVERLVATLRKLNDAIGDPHYEVGITFFLRPSLSAEIEHIWGMEIEPYLEEYFFDKSDRVAEFRWERIREHLFE